MPARPVVAVVGSGLTGCSIAYHLCRAGGQRLRVVIVDPNQTASGATARSAGCVIGLSDVAEKTRLAAQTVADMGALTHLLGADVGFRRTGTMQLASDDSGLAALARQADSVNATLGHEMACVLNGTEAEARVPWLRCPEDSVAGAALTTADGVVDPGVLAGCYLQAARKHGTVEKRAASVQHFHTAVSTGDGATTQRRVVGLVLNGGEETMACDYAVNAAGAWAGPLVADLPGSLGDTLGGLPYAPTRSHYWTCPSAPADVFGDSLSPAGLLWPTTIIPHARMYARMEGASGALLGVQEAVSLSWDARTLSVNNEAGGAPAVAAPAEGEDATTQAQETLFEAVDAITQYMPAVVDAEWRHYAAGLSTYTADGGYLLGPLPGIQGLAVATGCNGMGISISGGAGRLMALQILGSLGIEPHSWPTDHNHRPSTTTRPSTAAAVAVAAAAGSRGGDAAAWQGGWAPSAESELDGLDFQQRCALEARLLGADKFSLSRFDPAAVETWAALSDEAEGSGGDDEGSDGVNSAAFRALCAAQRGVKYQKK